MATWGEARKFTWNEARVFTWDQLNRLNPDELTALANSKIENIAKSDTAFANELKMILTTISINVASDIIYDAIKGTDWLTILKKFVQFLQSF